MKLVSGYNVRRDDLPFTCCRLAYVVYIRHELCHVIRMFTTCRYILVCATESARQDSQLTHLACTEN